MKFDFYESFKDGCGEHKLTKSQVFKIFTKKELERMAGPEAEEIVHGNLKYWAEEAIVYSRGIKI